MVWFYRVWTVAVVGGFAWAGMTGWRMSSTPHERIDPSVRSSPGGYRSYHFWHSGFSGGK